jgi:hypothetical protein
MNPKGHYDSVSDTYFIFFYGEPEPSISLDVSETMYALLDPETEDLIGIQIEAYTSVYVPQHPWLEPYVDVLTGRSASPHHAEQVEQRDLANYLIGSLITEGSLTTA